jgi:hypothetical protein
MMRGAEEPDEALVKGLASVRPMVGFPVVIDVAESVGADSVIKPEKAVAEVLSRLVVVEAITALGLVEEVDVARREVRVEPEVVERRLDVVGKREDMNGRPVREKLPISPLSGSVTFIERKVEFPPM